MKGRVQFLGALALGAITPGAVGAQDSMMTGGLRPWRATLLTNFGVYAVGHGERVPASYGPTGVPNSWRTRTEVSFRVLADWGVLLPLDTRRGVGASLVVSLDRDYSFVGLYGRYRHRIDSTRSVDVGLGIPLSRGDGVHPLGLLKYNMTRHVGVALRSEVHHEAEYQGDVLPGPYVDRRRLRLAAGAEIGGLTGAITSVATAAAIIGAVIAILSSGGWS